MIRWEQFYRYQLVRVGFRALVIWSGVRAAFFWIVLIAGCIWLQVWALVPVVWLILIGWLVLALPTLIIELAILTDVANYIFTKKAHVLLRFNELTEEEGDPEKLLADMRKESPLLYWYARAAEAMSNTSPITPVALWGLLVLCRLPSSAYSPRGPATVLQFPRRVRYAETRLVASFRDRAIAR